MAFQLDDLLKDDKKDANLIPDLSKATCNSQEEFRRLMERCPEYKIKAEKKEDIRVRDKDFSWRATKRELKSIGKEWGYGDPIPPDMKSLNLQELQQVAIDWRMLTSVRPKLRQDEEMFSRLVEMGKLAAKTSAKENRAHITPIRRNKNRAGIIESSVKICGECGEEFCAGESCGDILYDSFIRVTVTPQQSKITVSADTAAIIAGMDKSVKKGNNKKKKVNGKNNNSRKSVKLLIRRRVRKSGRSPRETHNKTRKNLKQNDNNNKETDENGIKKFKRKCSKYSKKGGLSPK
ncbi:uncharacterized protein LOC127291023 isoform X2 [Leptopilina boulardi]|uniref:uncharacterized protein LOC127291023 isoform X2 n=1 Tax=Leptopilina boulardi TaxID=63433 RepID=UPI0021F56C89|nr:uncharacterized protein LOC127291023 isoform X2 [Leptopilina boulardi]